MLIDRRRYLKVHSAHAERVVPYDPPVRIQLRTAVVSGVTAVLVLSGVSVAPAGARAASPTAPRTQAERHALEVLDDVRAAYVPQRRAPGTRLPYRDLTVLLRQLQVTRGDLPRSERATADRYLARSSAGSAGPTTSCTNGGLLPDPSVQYYATAHFCVHYPPGRDAYAQQVGAVLEHVWSVEVGTLGFRAPLSDGDNLLDVDVTQDLGSNSTYGWCRTTASGAQSPAYCALDDDFAPSQYGAPTLDSLQVTAAHEFFHAIQFGYNADQETWAMEGTAVWAEDEVYPDVNDYVQYLRYSPVVLPGTPIDSSGPYERYGIVVFWKFLAEYLGDPGAVRSFWEYADAPAGRTALQAVTAMLGARGQAFGTTFARFAAWNTLPAGSYADRSLWPGPVFAADVQLRPRASRMATRGYELNHLASTALVIRTAPRRRPPPRRLRLPNRLRVLVNGPAGSTSPQALIQLRMRSGVVRYVPVPLNGNGDGSTIVGFNPARVVSAVVTLSNASLGRADGQPFYVAARLVR